ncbi:metallophosphoesterase family protein [Wenzhouxiangella sp. EGI_FJ10409]|uniref:hypothetical protein n=1 Tax=Wenzhouxiangella sp. EGI_FJ10409 TaxID=3243767 RepID=UPI0035DCFE30
MGVHDGPEYALERSQPGLDIKATYNNPDHPGYPADARPVFFGHYWKKGSMKPERPNAACVDYSAGHYETLAAYRLGGDASLGKGGFVAERVLSPTLGS